MLMKLLFSMNDQIVRCFLSPQIFFKWWYSKTLSLTGICGCWLKCVKGLPTCVTMVGFLPGWIRWCRVRRNERQLKAFPYSLHSLGYSQSGWWSVERDLCSRKKRSRSGCVHGTSLQCESAGALWGVTCGWRPSRTPRTHRASLQCGCWSVEWGLWSDKRLSHIGCIRRASLQYESTGALWALTCG